jgi:tetratricopeptide (TPR) repeat protein
VQGFLNKGGLRSVLLATTVGMVMLGGCSDPDSRAAKYVKHGEELIAEGQPDKARLEFRNALKIKPTLAEPYYQLGLLDEANGDLRSAFENYSRAEQQDRKHQGALVKLAGFYFGAERFDDAQSRLDTVLKDHPDDAAAHAINAAIMLHKGDKDGASKEVATALKLDPANVPAISVQVGLYSANNDLDKAVAALNDGIQRNPNDTSLAMLKVELFKKHNQLDKVAEAYEALFKLQPAQRDYRAAAAAYFSDQSDLDHAEKILRDGIAAVPGDIEMKRLLVSFLNIKRGFAAAEAELQKLIAAEPNNSNYLFWLTDLYVQHKAVDQAVALLNQIIVKSGTDQSGLSARAALARITFARGDQEMANKLLSVVLEKQPGNLDALFIRAAINFDQGRLQSAITDLRSLLRDHPKTPEALQLLTEALVKAGHVDLAADTLAQLLDLQPDNHAAQARLAQLYHMVGDEKRSNLMLTAVTTQAPTYAIGWESQARIALDLKDAKTADTAIARLEAMPDQLLTANYLRGVWLLGQGKPEDAIAKFASVLTSDATAPQASLALTALTGTYRQLGRIEVAAHFIEGLKGDTADIHTALADCYIDLKKPDAAAKEYERAMALATYSADPFIGRAKLYLEAGQTTEAEGVLKKAQAVAPADARAPLLLADIATRAARYPEATKIYEELLAVNPEMDIAANNYAELIADYQYTDTAALEKARIAVDRFQASDQPALLDTVAWVYYRLGQYQQAASFMQRVVTSKDITPQMHYHYGAMLLKQGNKEQAAIELKKATADNATYPGIEDAKLLLSQL